MAKKLPSKPKVLPEPRVPAAKRLKDDVNDGSSDDEEPLKPFVKRARHNVVDEHASDDDACEGVDAKKLPYEVSVLHTLHDHTLMLSSIV